MPAPDVTAIQRRTLTVVVIGQVLGGAGLAAGVTVGALLAQDMLGTDGLAGVPTALFTLGSALTAYLVGRVSQRAGRRIGLGLGFVTGGVGALGVVLAAALDSVPLLFLFLFVYGAGTATNLQARYAGTDLATPATRGRAISTALVATTIGAVAGPNLTEPLGHVAMYLGLPPLAGPFLLAGVAYLAAGAALFALLRPDPLLLARATAVVEKAAHGRVPPVVEEAAHGRIPPVVEEAGHGRISPVVEEAGHGRHETPPRAPARIPAGAAVGATIMVLTQIAMVAIMTMTPVHMRHFHHSVGDVGLVIGLHIAAMYLPSPLTGVLVDRVGRLPTALSAGVVLLAAGAVAASAPGDSMPLTILALVLLGLGWNLGLISGTAIVVDATTPAERPRTQGTIDVLVALAGAGGGLLSGAVVAISSYATLSLGCGLLALVLVPALALSRGAPQPASQA